MTALTPSYVSRVLAAAGFRPLPSGTSRADGHTVTVDDRFGSWQADVRIRRGARTFRRAFVLPHVAAVLQSKVPARQRTTTKREAVRS